MKIPYGISNFKSLREEGYLYIDKTEYIEKIENLNSKYLFFMRPRRFGKSLFLPILEHYYDINGTKDFEGLFGDLYIGKNPTAAKNGYLILELDFSGLNTENKFELEKSFKLRLIHSITRFIKKYEDFLENLSILEDSIKNMSDVGSIFSSFINVVKEADKKVYLIIDEYDHFANDIIAMGDGVFYKEIVRAAGFVRDFYETVKIGTKSVIDRIFITGISPIMLDDMTSGFNISTNLTMHAGFNEMLGFTEDELTGIIEAYGMKEGKDKLVERLRTYYNGYLFNVGSKRRLYNPDMILYFFSELQMSGEYPRQLIDDNVKTDYGRLGRLASNEDNKKLLEEIIKEEAVTSDIVSKFSFDRMYDRDYFVSLLFYMGMLTIDRQEKTRLLLRMPNYVIKTLYWEYIENKLKKEFNVYLETESLRRSIEEMAYEGKIEPYIQYISKNVLMILSNRDLIGFDEKYIKVILFTYLASSRAYKINSERETENGYIDIYLEKDLRMPDVKYEWLLELKYIKKSDSGKIRQITEEGLNQLKRYTESRNITGSKKLKRALLIFIGKDVFTIVNCF